jgi:hypothetical protein
MDFRHGAPGRETYGSGFLHPRPALSWLIERRSVHGVRRPATLLSCRPLRVLLPVSSSTAWLRLGVWPTGPGERDWMGPSVVGLSG